MSGTAAQRSKQAGRSAARKADSPWVKTLGQVGVAAIGVVYLLLAWIALQVAFGGSDKSADNSGALSELADSSFGKVLLAVMAVGLFFYAVWQAIEAVIGFEEKSGNEKTFKRVSSAAKALFGLALAVQSLKLVMGSGSKSSGQKQQDWTSKLLELPAGRVLVVIIGLAVIAFSAYLIYKGVKKKFLEKLEGGADQKVVKLGQVGWIARGVAFGVLGLLVVVAGFKEQPEKSRGLDAALKTLADQPFGKWILVAVALGLGAYAVFQLVTARHRREG
jgi:amino acid transporter